MRCAVILLNLLFFAITGWAQQDYFYAENLVNESRHAEAVQVLDHLMESGAYADRPRFQMMTLNLAGTTKLYLKDTIGGVKCFEDAMKCYDTLTPPRKADDWNRREYYKAGYNRAQVYYRQQKFTQADAMLLTIQPPGNYYSATGSDVLLAQDDYYLLRARIFEHRNMPDSAFALIRKVREAQHTPAKLDSMFDGTSNTIAHVQCVKYSGRNFRNESTTDFLFFVAWTDSAHTQHSIWFTHPQGGPVQIMGRSTYNTENDQGFPANCYRMSLSPDEKYLAIECYTEGSNHIEVMSFPEIISEKKCIVKHSLLAYPASLNILGWEQSQLWLESDTDLTKLNKKPRLPFSAYPENNKGTKQQFLFDPESGKYTRK